MKKIVAMIMTSVMVTLSAAGCSGGSSAAPAAPAAENAAESVSEVAYANEISASEYTDNVFRKLINMEIGTAGSSLKAAHIAEEILTFVTSREIGNVEESARKAAFNEAWESLSSEEKGTVKDNFQDLAGLIDGAFGDYESVRGDFEDAGVGAEMEELVKSEGAQKSWKVLCDLLAEVK